MACSPLAEVRSGPSRPGPSAGRGGLCGLLVCAALLPATAVAQTRFDPFADPTTAGGPTAPATLLRGTVDPAAERADDTRRLAPAAAPAAPDLMGILPDPLEPTPRLQPTRPVAPAVAPPGGTATRTLLVPAQTPAADRAPATTPGTTGTADPAATTGAVRPARPVVPEQASPRVEPVQRTGSVRDAGPVAAVTATEPRPRDAAASAAEELEPDDDGYTPLGLRTGSIVWSPAIELSAGGSTNVPGKAGGKSGSLWRVAPELVGVSDRSRHQTRIDLRGSYTGNGLDQDWDRPSFRGTIDQRLDLNDETRVDLGAGWAYERQTNAASDNPTTTVRPSDVETATANLGLTRDIGRIAVRLRGTLERSDYSGGTTTSGVSLNDDLQNNTRAALALRTTLGTNAGLRPFVEVQTSHRVYDSLDANGVRRDSDGRAIEVGVVADLGPMLRGELAGGWGIETPHVRTLPEMSGWLFDGSLVWSPSRLTSVKLTAQTTFVPTTTAGASGAVARTLGVRVDRSLRRDLAVNAGVAVTDKTWIGVDQHERTVTLDGGLTYRFDRNVQTFVRGAFDHFASSTSAADYSAASVLVGVRLQR